MLTHSLHHVEEVLLVVDGEEGLRVQVVESESRVHLVKRVHRGAGHDDLFRHTLRVVDLKQMRAPQMC